MIPNLSSGDFTVALFFYFCRCIRENRFQELRDLGLTERQIEEARRITVCELVGMAHRVHNIKPDTAPAMLFRKLEMVRAEDRKRLTMVALIHADAPRSEMQRLYKLHSAEYREIRRQCGVRANASTRATPSEAEIESLHHAMHALGIRPESVLTAEEYLALVKTTGLSVRAIAKALKEPGVKANAPDARGKTR